MESKSVKEVAESTGLSEEQVKRKYPFSFGQVKPVEGTFKEGMAQAVDLGTDVAPILGTAKAITELPEDAELIKELVAAGYEEGDFKKMGLGGAYTALTVAGLVPGVKVAADIAKKGIKEGVEGAVEETANQTARAFVTAERSASVAKETSEVIPVMPVNQAKLTEKGFDFKPGGDYINPITKEILTGKKVGNANIKIIPDMEIRGGRPMASFNVTDLDVSEVGSAGKGKTQILVNLVKPTTKGNKAGWSWNNVENEQIEGVNTLVSVVHKGKHYFTLETDFSKGAELKTYPNSQSEPRLRPTAIGELDLQEQVGTIKMKDKTHPVYRKITAFASGGLAMAEGGVIPMDRQMDMFQDGGLEQDGGTNDPVSGNEVPPGSTQEEVRDDIPAQLSEGEFVFPADVVRYIGLGNLMRMRQEAKLGLRLMEEMGQMGNSEEATMSDDLPFDINDLDMDDEPEYNVGGFVPGTAQQQQFGITGFQQAPTQTMGAAAQPVQAASQQFIPQPITRPAQAYVPVQQVPTPLPTFGEITGPGVPEVDYEFATFRNEAGQEIQLKIKKGSQGELLPGEVLPDGYSWSDPTATQTEEVTTAPTSVQSQTSRVLSQEDLRDRDDADAARRQADIDQYGNASTKIGLKDFFGEGKDHIYGVNYVDGFGMGMMGVGQVLKGTIGGGDFPEGAMIMLKNGDDEILLTGEEYTIFRNAVRAEGTDYSSIVDLMDSGREAAERARKTKYGIEIERQKASKEGKAALAADKARRTREQAERSARRGKRDEMLAGLASSDFFDPARSDLKGSRQDIIERLQEQRNTEEEQKKLAEAQAKAAAAAKKSADDLAEEAARRAAEQRQRNQQQDDGPPPSGSPTQYSMDTGFEDRTDFGGSSGPFAKGGLASKPKPKAKKMKRGGLASKK